MDDAIANKQFADAEDINGEIEKLQELFAAEKAKQAQQSQTGDTNVPLLPRSVVTSDGERKTFEYRADLETEIERLSLLVSKSVKQKEFCKRVRYTSGYRQNRGSSRAVARR